MAKRLVFVALLTCMLGIGAAWGAPGDPFGGDDTGSIPPDALTQKCEARVSKALAKYVKCMFSCHIDRAKGKLPTPDSEDGCESICAGKYDITIGKLTSAGPPACPPSCMSPMSIRLSWKANIDGNNNQIYCENTQPAFGGDDTGFLPSNDVTAKCETKIGGLAAKLAKCLMTCHDNRSKEKTDPTTEETCEDGCKTKYTTKAATVTGCPACLTPTGISNYGDNVRTQTDNNNGLVYCAN